VQWHGILRLDVFCGLRNLPEEIPRNAAALPTLSEVLELQALAPARLLIDGTSRTLYTPRMSSETDLVAALRRYWGY